MIEDCRKPLREVRARLEPDGAIKLEGRMSKRGVQRQEWAPWGDDPAPKKDAPGVELLCSTVPTRGIITKNMASSKAIRQMQDT